MKRPGSSSRTPMGSIPASGAPDKVHGLDDKKVEEIDYECSRHNIHLIKCPVRHMGTEYSFETLRGMYQYLMKQPGFTFRELTRLSA